MKLKLPVFTLLLAEWLVVCAAFPCFFLPQAQTLSEKLTAEGRLFEAGLVLPVMTTIGITVATYCMINFFQDVNTHLDASRLTRPQADTQDQKS